MIAKAPRVGSLAEDLHSAQRIVVARTIEVDDIAFAGVLQDRTIGKQAVFSDRREAIRSFLPASMVCVLVAVAFIKIFAD